MTFFLDKNATREELTDAVNYLLANFIQAKTINPNSGEITSSTTGISGYLYRYLHIKYADSFNGEVNFSNIPTNRLYYGIYNSDSDSESLEPKNYLWTEVPGGFGTTKNVFYITTGGRQIQIAVGTTKPDIQWIPDDGFPIDLDKVTSSVVEDLNPIVYDKSAEIANLTSIVQSIPQPQLGTLAPVNIDWVPYLGFDTAPAWIGTTAGQFWYDSTTGSFNAKMGNNNITQQIGEEIFEYGKASQAISDTNVQIIYKTGTVGASGTITMAPTVAGITNPNLIIGCATETLAKNAIGRCTSFGYVHGINTTGSAYGETWADNDVIWYNPVTGNPTKVKPSAPNIKVQIGTVIYAGPGGSGTFKVEIDRGSTLGGTDSNVQFGTLATNDLIQYNGTYWTNTTVASVIASANGAPVVKTADFTVANGETWLINNKAGSTCTVTLPTASSNTGRVLHFQNYQAFTLVSASANVIPLVGGAASTAILSNVAGDTATLVCNGTNWVMTQYTPNNVLLLE